MCRLPQHDMTGVLSTMYIRFINVALEGRGGGETGKTEEENEVRRKERKGEVRHSQ